MKKSRISPSCILIGWWPSPLLYSPHEVRNPEQKLIDHGAQANQDPHVENGDHHQHDLAIPQLVLLARPVLQLVANKGVYELLAVRLLLDEPGGEEVGKKHQKNDSAQHIEDWIHDACS